MHLSLEHKDSCCRSACADTLLLSCCSAVLMLLVVSCVVVSCVVVLLPVALHSSPSVFVASRHLYCVILWLYRFQNISKKCSSCNTDTFTDVVIYTVLSLEINTKTKSMNQLQHKSANYRGEKMPLCLFFLQLV